MDEVWFLNFQSFLSNGNDIVFDIWGFTSERINRRVVVGEMHRILRSPAVMALQIQVMVVEENCDGLAVEEENCNGLMTGGGGGGEYTGGDGGGEKTGGDGGGE
ncbi:hypothetical protein AtEden1_Chr3g0183941 [Arabidopsis thaliana]